MKPPPSPSPGRADQQLPAPGLALLLRSCSHRRSRRVALLPTAFISRSRSADAEVSEPSSPKVTCIGQVRMRNSRGNKKGKCSTSPETKEYFRCFKKVFFCGWLFGLSRKRPNAPSLEADTKKENQVEVTAAKAKIARKLRNIGQVDFMSPAPPPTNALLLTRCRSAPQNRASPVTSRFPVVAQSSAKDAKKEVDSRGMEGKRQEVAIGKGQGMRLVMRRCKSESAAMATEVAEATRKCFWAQGRKNQVFRWL